jgi:DNA-binding transcriptional LysR family regulator
MILVMRETNLAGIDLNLLPALEALIRRRNVTRAGEDVGLSQPAMSRALARLRDLLDDPILVKTASGLAPTARAQNLLPQLSAALDGAAGILRPPAFDATTLDRTFRIVGADAQTLLLGPALMAALAREAPRASLMFLPVTPDVRERIEAGDVDLVFATSTTPLPPGAHSETVAQDGFALACRRGLRAPDHVWTLPEYAAQAHATVSIFGDRLTDIDAELAEAGLVRRIAFTSPHFLGALATVAATDCVTVLSAALARRFAPAFGLQLHEPPLKQKDLTLTTVASATRAQDPALMWLRARLHEAAEVAMAT